MGSTVDAEPSFTSSPHDTSRPPDPQGPPDPIGIGIGEAARRVGLAPSAVRFYEREGLLDPAPRRDGRRRYGRDQLRRLAFIAIARDLGLGLAAIRAALHPGPQGWARVVDEQIAVLDARLAHAQRARAVLAASRDCPAPEPVRDCPYLREALDALLEPGRAQGHTAPGDTPGDGVRQLGEPCR